mgnify:FL=1
MSNIFGRIQREHYNYTMKDLAAALVQASDVHEGIWRVGFKFELRAANVNMGGQQLPAAFLPIVQVDITRVEVLDDLSVDAAQVNPVPLVTLASATTRVN